jgi:Fe-S oxidoreductase
MPWLANFATQTPGLRRLSRKVAGVSPKRRIPALAKRSFRKWFSQRTASASRSKPRVLIWPDTFNNYFHPETAIAAVEVLETAGFSIGLPRANVCCGRPLYDFGMLDRAKALLRRTMKMLSTELEENTPIVVLEPSCASVFRDELLNLFPEDPQARKLASQVVLFSEFLENNAVDLPVVSGNALVHGHCHQKSIMKMDSEESVLRRIGAQYSVPAPGCCGMAGAFGFEQATCDVSLAIGELELLPAVRSAPADTLIIANGFSCREQIEQCTGRKTLHLADLIRVGQKQKA